MNKLVLLEFILIHTISKIYGENITISTPLGDVIGNQQSDYVEFKGIPYTENKPIGMLRFTESVIKTSPYLNDAYDATYYRFDCIQADTISYEQSEDCLYLNIFTPNIDVNGSVSTELLPVMVWIHGGAFTAGGGAGYDGKSFMKKSNIIFVSINYRLGILGFLAAQSIFNETNGKTTGGLNGLNDQIVALQWIQNYIEDYGGDPFKVTIFGESAGGFSACFLTIIPRASDLFSQAIIQSGHCSIPQPYGSPAPTEVGLSLSLSIISAAGLTDNLTMLRSADVSVLRTVTAAIYPSVDGYLLQDTTQNMLFNNDFTLNVDKIIIGSDSMDTLLLWPWFYSFGSRAPVNEYEFDGYLAQYLPDEASRELIKNTYYPLSDFASGHYQNVEYSNQVMRWGIINADICFKCSGIWYLDRLLTNNMLTGNDLYLYNFIGPAASDYVTHGGELIYFFPELLFTLEILGQTQDDLLSNLMIDSWVNFAVYGAPNSSRTDEEWMPFGSNESCMVFGTDTNDGNSNYNVMNFNSKGYRNGACDFWINEMGWDVIDALCMDRRSLNPTQSPTKSPTMSMDMSTSTTSDDGTGNGNMVNIMLEIILMPLGLFFITI